MILSPEAERLLSAANRKLTQQYPGDRPLRQPIPTVYGGAQLYKAETTKRLGELALANLHAFAPSAEELAHGVGFASRGASSWLIDTVYRRVVAKLEREAVEDFRIDFEDGYGNRPDDEEDGHAASAARQVAEGMKAGTISPFIGIRIKPFSQELTKRSLRTLELFVSTLM